MPPRDFFNCTYMDLIYDFIRFSEYTKDNVEHFSQKMNEDSERQNETENDLNIIDVEFVVLEDEYIQIEVDVTNEDIFK